MGDPSRYRVERFSGRSPPHLLMSQRRGSSSRGQDASLPAVQVLRTQTTVNAGTIFGGGRGREAKLWTAKPRVSTPSSWALGTPYIETPTGISS